MRYKADITAGALGRGKNKALSKTTGEGFGLL